MQLINFSAIFAKNINETSFFGNKVHNFRKLKIV